MTRNGLNDRELDRLLSMATQPQPPQGAEARLLARLPPAATADVVAFRRRPAPRPGVAAWLTALPFAASLAFGLWLGLAGLGTGLLPASLGGDAMAAADDAVFSGVDDAEVLDEDGQT
jgi:hypothetical protein